jgi:hypothetical protein
VSGAAVSTTSVSRAMVTRAVAGQTVVNRAVVNRAVASGTGVTRAHWVRQCANGDGSGKGPISLRLKRWARGIMRLNHGVRGERRRDRMTMSLRQRESNGRRAYNDHEDLGSDHSQPGTIIKSFPALQQHQEQFLRRLAFALTVTVIAPCLEHRAPSESRIRRCWSG